MKRPTIPIDAVDVAGCAGALLLVYGTWKYSHPAGYIVAGLLLLGCFALGAFAQRRKELTKG